MKSLSSLTPSRRWLFLPPLAIGVAVVAYLASSRKELLRVEAGETATPLQVVRVNLQPVRAQAVGFGTAKPRRLWSAIAEVGGRVVETRDNLRSGVAVRAGETLLTIDPADYRLRVGQRAAELDQAKAQLAQLKLNQSADERSLAIQQELLKVRQSDVDRLQQLRTRSAASQSEADVARAILLQQSQAVQTLKNTLTTYPAQIASAEAAVALAVARLTEAERDVDRTKIVAPFDGLLSGVTLEPNQFVAPNQVLFQIHDTELVEIEAQFSISQVRRVLGTGTSTQVMRSAPSRHDLVKTDEGKSMADRFSQPDRAESIDASGLSASVTSRSGDVSIDYSGQVVRMTESLDERTRTQGVVVRVRNDVGQSAALRPGAFCEVTVAAKESTMAFLVPRTSFEQDFVYVVDKENRLQRRGVRIAFPLRKSVAVVDGLSDGDLVVVHPPTIAIDGELIKPELIGPEQGDHD